jgi:hypothetical protein
MKNLAIHIIRILIIEWWEASQHLVEQDTKGPPIHRLGVAIAKQKLRSKVFGSTAECYFKLAA